jgi:hypothetical protein
MRVNDTRTRGDLRRTADNRVAVVQTDAQFDVSKNDELQKAICRCWKTVSISPYSRSMAVLLLSNDSWIKG